MRTRDRRFLILVACLTALALVLTRVWWQPKLYTVTVLPTLGGDFVLPWAINERGQVAGFADVPKPPGTTRTKHRLFLWDRATGMQDLGPVQNDRVAINNAGQIVATMEDPNGRERAFIWDPNHGRMLLPTLGGGTSRALAINDLGQVVGEAETPAGVRHAFLWDPVAGIQDLMPTSTTENRAWSVNDAGKIVVFGKGGPFLVSADDAATTQRRSIPVRGLIRISDVGEIAAATQTGSRRWEVVLWREGSGVQTLFQLEAESVDTPFVNDVGQVVVGWRDRLQFRLFERPLFPLSHNGCLWDPRRGRISLDRYLGVGRGEDFWLTDLNDQGCIVGQVAATKDSRSRGILLEPIPERWGK